MPSKDDPENPIPRLIEIAEIEELARQLTKRLQPERDELIRRAVEKNYSQGKLALITKLDQTRIGQIVRSRS
jgi:hypothetical protein